MKNFKMVSKNSVGGAALLLFFIVISQARLFDFLIDTSLGRFLLILMLICLSYCHGILGVVGVLLIIIAFNHSGLSFLSEGFETSTSDITPTPRDGSLKAKIQANPTASAAVQAQIQNKAAASGRTLPTTTDPATTTTDTTATDTTATDTTATTESFVTTRGLEGFDVLGIENNLKRGKQSNSIPVSSYSKQDSDFISAYEGSSSIFGNFSLF
jgi:hypothetical protein